MQALQMISKGKVVSLMAALKDSKQTLSIICLPLHLHTQRFGCRLWLLHVNTQQKPVGLSDLLTQEASIVLSLN